MAHRAKHYAFNTFHLPPQAYIIKYYFKAWL